jgi:hypothetical protein
MTGLLGKAFCRRSGSPPFAYAFYATDERYAVSALIAIWQLEKLGVPPDIGFVILHPGVGGRLLARFRRPFFSMIRLPS